MNIFVTDPDPVQCAKVLPDKHIVKMPLETCQMLSIVCSDERIGPTYDPELTRYVKKMGFD